MEMDFNPQADGLSASRLNAELVRERGDEQGAKNFKASAQWYSSFRKRWGFTFQEKTNVKKSSLEARLPYVRKFHQYLLYTAFNEEPQVAGDT